MGTPRQSASARRTRNSDAVTPQSKIGSQPHSTGKRKRTADTEQPVEETQSASKRKRNNQNTPQVNGVSAKENALGDFEPRSSGRQRKVSQKLAEAEEQRTTPSRTGRKSASRTEKAVQASEPEEPKTPKNSAKRSSRKSQPEPESEHIVPISNGIEPEAADSLASTSKKRGPRRGQRGPETGPSIQGNGHTEIVVTHAAEPASVEEVMEHETPSKKHRIAKERSELAIPSPFEGVDQPTEKALEPENFPSLQSMSELLQDAKYAAAFETLKEELLLRLTSKRRLPLMGLKREYHKVHQLVEQTVVAGEGNSMLVIGSRGGAKTMLVETVISQVSQAHSELFHVIRLNGFLQTDDKLALKEIWRQLGMEVEGDEDGLGQRTNYADTLASLLAVLSHPSEMKGEETNRTSKSVIFILEEFDLFTTHPRQTLLYNLFDIAQSRKAPIAILGLTTRLNVVELLEKRVKSRFSHRYVHLAPPRMYSAFLAICQAALHCNPSEGDPTSPVSSESLLDSDNNLVHHKLLGCWSAFISDLFSSKRIHPLLYHLYCTSKSIPAFMTAALIPFASLTPSKLPTLPALIAAQFFALSPPESKHHLLPGLADLELALLIAAARLDIVLDTDAVNFNLAYDEYLALARRSRITGSAAGQVAVGGSVGGGGRVWSRDVALGAWEKLAEVGLLVPVLGLAGSGGAAGGGGADLGRRGRLWRCDVSLEEIGASGLELSPAMARWCREI